LIRAPAAIRTYTAPIPGLARQPDRGVRIAYWWAVALLRYGWRLHACGQEIARGGFIAEIPGADGEPMLVVYPGDMAADGTEAAALAHHLGRLGECECRFMQRLIVDAAAAQGPGGLNNAWPTRVFEGGGLAEYDELWSAIRFDAPARSAACRVAAMAVRFVAEISGLSTTVRMASVCEGPCVGHEVREGCKWRAGMLSVSARRWRGGPVENRSWLADYYRMSSEPISVDTAALRHAAGGNADTAAAFDDYYRQCQQWLGDAELEVIDCHGVIAAPVGAALRDFYDRLSAQVAAAIAGHSAVAANLAASAHRYDSVDAAGADGVRAAGEAL